MTDMLFSTGVNNPGGNYLIRFVPVAGIQSMPAPATSGPSTVASFKTGFRWFQVYGTEGSKTVDEQEDDSDQGPVWSVKVVTYLPGDSSELRQQLADMVRHRFVLEVEDNTRVIRRIGTPIESFQLSYSFKTGGAMAERRGATLTFKGQLTAPAPILYYP
jgi:hypothetical protein